MCLHCPALNHVCLLCSKLTQRILMQHDNEMSWCIWRNVGIESGMMIEKNTMSSGLCCFADGPKQLWYVSICHSFWLSVDQKRT